MLNQQQRKTIDLWELEQSERDKGSRTSLYNICNLQASLFYDDCLSEYRCWCGRGNHDFIFARTPLLFKKDDSKVLALYGTKYDTNFYGLMPLDWNPPDKNDYLIMLGKVVEKLPFPISE